MPAHGPNVLISGQFGHRFNNHKTGPSQSLWRGRRSGGRTAQNGMMDSVSHESLSAGCRLGDRVLGRHCPGCHFMHIFIACRSAGCHVVSCPLDFSENRAANGPFFPTETCVKLRFSCEINTFKGMVTFIWVI